MKILSIILAVLLTLVVLLGIGLQIFLTKGLTRALNQGVFPSIRSMYGLEMSITNASVNLIKGDAVVQGLSVRNLKGYEEPMLLTFDTCRLDLDMKSLLKRDPVVIKLVEAKGAVLTVERNQERKFNVKELADALKPVESAAAPTKKPAETKTQEPTPAAKKADPIPVHIRRLAIDVTVVYADPRHDRRLPLNLRLTGSDLFTIPAEGHPDSLLVLRGSLAHDEDAYVTDINAIIKPLTDPANPSFNATGSILDIDADFLKNLLEKNEMSSGPFSIKPSITCEKGKLDGSQIDLSLTDFKIYGSSIGETTLTLPLSGTLKKPVVNLTGALQTLFSEQSFNILKAVGLKEAGITATDDKGDMLMQGLTNSVEEIADSPELQKLIQQVIPGTNKTASTTNAPIKETLGNVLFEQLEKNVKEVEGNEAIRNTLKSLFGN